MQTNYLKYFGGLEAVRRRFVELFRKKLTEVILEEVKPLNLNEKDFTLRVDEVRTRIMEELGVPFTLLYGDGSVITRELVDGCIDFLGIGWDEILGDCVLTDNDIVELNIRADEEQFVSMGGRELTSEKRAEIFALIKACREI